MVFSKSTLSSGLRVIMAPILHNTTVTVLCLTGTGSKYETKDINGISHFLEHMCFKGTEKRPSAQQISHELDAIGGEFNAFTSKEYTGYYAKVRSEHALTALDVVSDIFLHQLIKEEEVQREKGVIIEEINLYLDTPTDHIGDVFEGLLYGDQPAGWPVVGSKENILKMTREDFVNYRNNHYTVNNSLLVLAGDPTALTKLQVSLEKMFAGIRPGDHGAKQKAVEAQQKPAVAISPKDTDQIHIALGVRTVHLLDPRRYALAVLATVLGGGMSSRLFSSVREQKALAYYVRTAHEQYTDTGYLATYAGVTKEKLEEAVQIIVREYKKIREEKVPPEELKKAKEYLKGKLTLHLEGSDEIAMFLGEQEILTKNPVRPAVLFERLEAVSAEDILRVAKEFLIPSNLNMALIGNYKNEKKLLEILGGL